MKSEKFNIVAALAAFVAVCLFGIFIGWISGVQAFTVQAGTVAFGTIAYALIAGVTAGLTA